MHSFIQSSPIRAAALTIAVFASGCGNGSVSNEESARRAYLGLDRAIDRALALGMDGFNSATSANIAPQTGMGDRTGTLTVTGQVDQGASANKQMRLRTAFAMYRDNIPAEDGGMLDVNVTYDTDAAALPALDLSLRNIPNGTFTGTFVGTVNMTGDLTGSVMLNLTLAGRIESTGTGEMIRRVPGSTTIMGTAVSRYGTFAVNLMR